MQEGSTLKRVLEFIENLLALKITDEERLRVAQDPSNIFQDDFSNQKPLRVAAIFALLFHIFIFLFYFPFLGNQVFIPQQEVLVLKQLALPSQLKG